MYKNHNKGVIIIIIITSSYVFVDPAFRLMRFPLDGKLDFYFKNDFIY